MEYEEKVYEVFMKNVPFYKSGETTNFYVYFDNGSKVSYAMNSASLYSFSPSNYYNREEWSDYTKEKLKKDLLHAVKFVDETNDRNQIIWSRGEVKYENKQQMIKLCDKYFSIEELEFIVDKLQSIKKHIKV